MLPIRSKDADDGGELWWLLCDGDENEEGERALVVVVLLELGNCGNALNEAGLNLFSPRRGKVLLVLLPKVVGVVESALLLLSSL